MNMKKIIPLTFATLSVAGALSACSDNKVVGADEHESTVALSSSSGVEPGSSGSNIYYDRLMTISRPNLAAAIMVYNDKDFVDDTINAHETFENAIQSIYGNDVVSYDSTKGFMSDVWAGTERTVVAMKDEKSRFYGPIDFESSKNARKIDCWHESKELASKGGGSQSDVYYVLVEVDENGQIYAKKRLLVPDTTVKAEFEQECALENGVFEENMTGFCSVSGGIIDDERLDPVVVPCKRFPEWYCSRIPITSSDRIYKDPYWKKYASHIVDGCVSPDNLD